MKSVLNDVKYIADYWQALLHLSKYRTVLAKAERKRWKAYVNWGRKRLYYDLRLRQYRQMSAPLALIIDCRRRLKYHKKQSFIAMSNLDTVVQGIRYFDRIMSLVFNYERDIYEDHLATI